MKSGPRPREPWIFRERKPSSNVHVFPTAGPTCVSPDFSSVSHSPNDSPLVVGTAYVFSFSGLTGTATFGYLWLINHIVVGTDATLSKTFINADVQNPDGGGLGSLVLSGLVYNCCGIDYSDFLGSYPIQQV